MIQLWEDLKYRPVVVFGVTAAIANAVAAGVDWGWLQVVAAALTGAGAFYTQRFTRSVKSLTEEGVM